MNKRDILGFSLGPIASAPLALAATAFIAWNFSPEDVGRNNLLQIFTSFSILFFILGLDQAYVREFHESSNRLSLLKNCFLPGMGLMTLTLLVSVPFSGQIARIMYGEVKPIWYFITMAYVLVSYILCFLSSIVRMQERGLSYSIAQILSKLVLILSIISYVQFSTHKSTYIVLLISNFLSVLSVVIIVGYITKNIWIPALSQKTKKSELKRLLIFGTPLIGAGITYWGLSATSAVMLRTFSGFKELGIYTMAMSFTGVTIVLQTIFSTLWMPSVYKWVAKNENLSRIHSGSGYMLVIVCFAFILIGMFSWVVDYILPIQYAGVKYILGCCSAQPLLYTLSETTVVGLNIQRKTMFAFGIALFSLLCSLAFSYILVPLYGAIGAAVANSIAYFIFFVLRTEVSSKVWIKIQRKKMYINISFILMVTIFLTFYAEGSSINVSFYWFLIFICYLLIFKKEIEKIFNIAIKIILN